MISKNQIKYIKSLHSKITRNEEKKFLVEGKKSLIELLNSDFRIEKLIISQDFYNENIALISRYNFEIIKENEITNLSTYKTNTDGIAVIYQKENIKLNNNNEIILVLDNIKDPGNLGTIIRIADFYSIKKIIASNNTCEFYNPKVISRTMGSFSRISIYYTNLEDYLKNEQFPIYGSFLSGEDLHKTKFEKSGFLVIGNESNGISKEIEKIVTKKITISKPGNAESLNAGVACGIIVDNIFRNIK
ncbi:RNA methyltransferase [Candidatus Gracilibacteria bacterium]|nr:RNA methyltransferase [Candidatus Gracilibacteria bacterium]